MVQLPYSNPDSVTGAQVSSGESIWRYLLTMRGKQVAMSGKGTEGQVMSEMSRRT
jgi:hypothetical protein